MLPFSTNRKASFKTKLYALALRLFPAYRRTGGKAIFISQDLQEVHIQLRLNWATRNYVGTIFGGSLYAAADPIYMIQLIQLLGKDYVVWDKAASIRFRKPGNQSLYIRFLISDELLSSIKQRLKTESEFDLELKTDWIDQEGKVYAHLSKTIYIANKSFYKNKLANKKRNKA